jgi:glycogen(starch) synthase
MEELGKRGIESSLMVPGYPVEVTGWAADYPLYFITPHTKLQRYNPRTWASFGASLGRSVLQIHLAMRRSGCDILHVQGTWAGLTAPAVASMLPRRWKTVVTFRDLGFHLEAVQSPSYRRWLGYLVRRASAVTAVSQEVADRALDVFSFLQGSIRVIRNGVEPFWFEPPEHVPSETYILFVGRLDSVKGLDHLLSAWKRLQSSLRAGAKLWLVGDGPERQAVEEMVQREGLKDSVCLWGSIQDMERLKSLYSGARALVLPSRSEGLPNVLTEAGACGTICIGSRVGGIPEVIVDGETGFLFPPGDVEALARAIQHVLEMSEGERRRMAEQARQRIGEHFTQARVVEQYIEVYQRAVGRRS